MSKNSFLDKIEVKNPCSQDWDEMRGSDAVRFCSHCDSSVNNLSAMTRKQALKIVRDSGGKICVRYVKNPETNAPVFREKLYQISRRTGIAAGVLGASLSLSSITYAQDEAKTSEAQPTVIRINQLQYFEPADDKEKDVELKPDEAETSISGTLTDASGNFVPNTTVLLTNEKTGETHSASTDEKGFYEFKNLAVGSYKLKPESSNGSAEINNIELTESQEIRQDISLNALEIVDLPIAERHLEIMGGIGMISFRTPLFQAVSGDELEETKNLITRGESVNAKDKNYGNITPLFLAVENGNLEIAEMLLDFGAKINAKDESRQTPLMRLDSDASPELVNLLIKHGAKVNLTDDEGNTALILASSYAKAEVLQVLIVNGANVNAKNNEGQTALMNAAEEGNLENVRALILAGANVNLKNKEGETARDLADDEEIEKLLESYGAKVN